MKPFSSFDEAQLWLESRINYELWSAPDSERPEPPSLDGIRALLDVLNNPHQTLPIIHITGTNGKTSTARMIARILGEYGITTGLYTSPHLQRINERWQLNLEPVPDDELLDVFGIISNAEQLVEQDLTYFDILTAAAFVLFADHGVEVAIMEVGMGGRWDCTNVADGDVAVITNISLDHTNFLGPTREDIAKEKAGIIKPKSAVVLGEIDFVLKPIFENVGGASYSILNRDFEMMRNEIAVDGRVFDARIGTQYIDEIFVSLHGRHQATNALIAMAAVKEFFGRDLDEDVVRAALLDVSSPGRLEVVNVEPLVLLDGAHNAGGAEALVASLEEEFRIDGNLTLVFGMFNGHNVEDFVEELIPVNPKNVFVTQADSSRAIGMADLARVVSEKIPDANIYEVPRVAEALQQAVDVAYTDDVIVVCGSLYVVGEAREYLLEPLPHEF